MKIKVALLVLLESVWFTQGVRADSTVDKRERNVHKTLHYCPENSKAGDVIPFYWDGEYHLFYLKGADWAHIVSQDLLAWEELPNALYQGTDSLGPDGEAIWTGSIVEQNGTFYLYYTGKNSRDPKGDQKVMQARSKDLINWEKQPELTFYADGKIYWNKPLNGAIDDKLIYHHQAFRDPHVVWNPTDKVWWMLLHATLSDGTQPAMGLYTSHDLTRWEPHTPLVVYPASVSGDCPDLFELNGRWNINCADYHYMQVDEPGTYNPPVAAYDCGDLRVAKTLYDGKRRILVGWIGEYAEGKDAGAGMWGGVMSMPRELYADADDVLFQRPPTEVINLYTKAAVKKTARPTLDQNIPVPSDYMLTATLKANGVKPVATLRFRQSPENKEESYRLNIDFQTQTIELCSKHKSFKRKCPFDVLKPVDIRLFVDGTVAECFVNDAYCFTMRIYDHKQGDISFSASDSALTVENLTVKIRQ